MSGVATKLLRRSRSVSFSSPSLAPPSPGGFTRDSRYKSMSMRSLHCSILHPRAPKIRHLNASHSLLIDLDKHIAKVQELEYKVSELEARIAEREALKCVQNQTDAATTPLPKITEALVSEEDRLAFQNRLNEARRRADELSRKTHIEEANILSWHSKRLKEVLETLSTAYSEDTTEAAPKLLAAPCCDEEVLQENKIFDALNALVGLAHDEANSQESELINDGHIVHLKNLVIERENLKLMLDGVRHKMEHANNTAMECQMSLQNLLASASALRMQLKSSQSFLFKSMLKKEPHTVRGASHSALWIYGPNPIFTGVGRLEEISASVQNTALEQALRKTEISQVVAEKNLEFAQGLVNKYAAKINRGNARLGHVEAEIEKQIIQVNSVEDTVVDKVCSKAKQIDVDSAIVADITTPDLPTRMND